MTTCCELHYDNPFSPSLGPPPNVDIDIEAFLSFARSEQPVRRLLGDGLISYRAAFPFPINGTLRDST